MQQEIEKILLQASDEGAKLSRGEISHRQYKNNIDKLLCTTVSRLCTYQEKREHNRLIHYRLTEHDVNEFKREIQAAVDRCVQSTADLCNAIVLNHNIDREKEVSRVICCEHIWQAFRELMKDEALD